MKIILSVLITLASVPCSTGPASSQRRQPLDTPSAQKPAQPSDDIIVEGLRDLDDPGSAVSHETLGSAKTGNGARRSASILALSMRFTNCAAKVSGNNHQDVRNVLDGTINSARQAFAQSRYIQSRSGCAEYPEIARQSGLASISSSYDTSYYDRGALYIWALRAFTPDLALTKAQTSDPIVQARFDAREIPLAKFRLPIDRQYFETAVCLVRMQPELAVKLVKADGADRIARLEAMIVNGGLPCVGNARHVYFDPSQFKMYVADAVYRWAVAVRGVDSLIPE